MTDLPSTETIWTPATEAEKTAALASLGALPSRATSSAELDRASYRVALEGVTRWGLSEGVRSILRGGLGHGFFPSPPELRMKIDAIMRPHQEKLRRDEQQRQEREALRREARDTPQTPAERARVKALYEAFCKQHQGEKVPEEGFRLDPTLVASVPDRHGRAERMGKGDDQA